MITPKNIDPNEKLPVSESDNLMNDTEFYDLMEKGFAPIKIGEIIKGKVISIDSSGVIVDIGYKSEGQVPLSEFQRNSDGSVDMKPGDEIEVYVIQRETPTGLVALSKSIADEDRGWTDLTNSFKNHTPLSGKVLSHTRAGFIIEYRGIQGFLPLSQSGLAPSEDPAKWIHQKISFHVIDVEKNRSRLIFSRKQMAEEERQTKKTNFMETLQEGARVKGTVKTITTYGAFIDIGEMDGLLHISDLSWKPVKSANDILKTGEEIEVVILKLDKETGRVSLGLKQKEPNPWDLVEAKYPVGTVITGKVTALTEYGAFVELESGIEGMIHVSEMSWTRRTEHPSQMVSVGSEVKAKILGIEKNNHRIALGIKQTQPDPWDEIEAKYPVGAIVKGKVTNITAFGAFVQIEEGIEGLIHKTDFSWNAPVNPADIVKVGQEVEARIIKQNHSQRKIGLGIKQLTPDPWLAFFKTYKEGSTVNGKVTKIADSGVFVELDGGIEGFCRISQLDIKKVLQIDHFCKVGDILEFKLTRLQKAQKRFVLSRRALLESEERADLKKYMGNVQEAKTNLGELLQGVTSISTIQNEENR